MSTFVTNPRGISFVNRIGTSSELRADTREREDEACVTRSYRGAGERAGTAGARATRTGPVAPASPVSPANPVRRARPASPVVTLVAGVRRALPTAPVRPTL